MLCFAGKGRLKPWSLFEADRVIRGVERHQLLILVGVWRLVGALETTIGLIARE